MKENETEKAMQQFASGEITELSEGDLEAVVGGSAVVPPEGGTNGNCSCPPGSPVPAGDWTNGNCST